MRIRSVVPLLVCLIGFSGPAWAQYEAPVASLAITASRAATWATDGTQVIQLEGPVSIDVDKNHLAADQAVIWISAIPGSIDDVQRVEFALVGNASLTQPNNISRTDRRGLYVDAQLRGVPHLTAERRSAINLSDSELYKSAAAMRPVLLKGGAPSGWIVESQLPATEPTSRPTTEFRPVEPIRVVFPGQMLTQVTPDQKMAAVFTGKVLVTQTQKDGSYLSLQADRAVIFTQYHDLKELQGVDKIKSVEQAAEGVYLEGDVLISNTPEGKKDPSTTLSANRAYYDFTTDRAVLTDVVMQSLDPKTQVPIVVRARVMRQLSKRDPPDVPIREFSAEHAQLSTSSFHTPSYSIGASSLYMRQTHMGDPVTGTQTDFVTHDTTFDIWGMPIFYTPLAAGTFTERSFLRRVEATHSSTFGTGVTTEFGLFETLGRLAPEGTDISYKLDYFSRRGPAVGLDVEYVNGFVSPTTLQPWSDAGNFTGYFVQDDGEDDLGKNRVEVTPDTETRGRFYWEHQHFLPDDWQVQITGGYISDPTFMEEWFRRDFRTNHPLDTSLYLKRQRDTEALTFLASFQPNDFATVSDLYQEQFEIERLPELGYRRIGDSFWNDNATFYSANTLSALRFKNSDPSLADLGFAPQPVGFQSPGLPSLGKTGTPDDTTYRGDFRQEIDFPFGIAQFRTVPYVIARYTAYSQSVDGDQAERVYAGAGIRTTTAFWKVDDSVESELFDIHRLRHVIEPELNLYGGAQSKDRADLLIYDEPIDDITDISAVQVALGQRWQTKRGGLGRWRSEDFLSLRMEFNYFFTQPPEPELNPSDFRGLYFVSMPEASIPRNSVNADAAWRISEFVTLSSDAEYNTDENMLATAAIGLRVKQDTRLSYYVGLRHIGLDFTQVVNGNTFVFEDQDLVIGAIDYELTRDYRVQLANSYDLAQHRNDRSSVSLIRHFNRFYASIGFRVDEFEDDNAVFFNVWPEGMEPGGGSNSVNNATK